jgi:4-amino-4-deoxy-L-arabinose transferase-like glycosyltransferase
MEPPLACTRESAAPDLDGEQSPAGWLARHRSKTLAAILLLSAALRLVALDHAPPGLNQDEAANAWNAWCLLHTGQDQFGVPYPIYYSRCFGENRSTLFFYLLLPFQALGGLNVWTTRLPCAVGGVAAVGLAYVLGRQLFGTGVALAAALLLAVQPWHIQQSRWGHEGGIGALLVMGSVAAWLWARLPFRSWDEPPRPVRALLAGLLTGICCYGYPAVRLMLPALLVLAGLASLPGWWRAMRSPRGAAGMAAFAIGLAATLGPLAWKHWTDPAIGKRGATSWAWRQGAPLEERIDVAAKRYVDHFAPDFLLLHGDRYDIQSPPGGGQLHYFEAPLLVAGVVILLWRIRRWPGARLALVWLLAYPLGDVLNSHMSAHAIRSLPGIGGLILVSAVGLAAFCGWVTRRPAGVRIAGLGLAAVVIAGSTAYFGWRFFGEYPRRDLVYRSFHADLVAAGEWLRPRLGPDDQIVCTVRQMNQPYSILLVTLGYDPRRWHSDEHRIEAYGPWEIYHRAGPMRFLYHRDTLYELTRAMHADRSVNPLWVIVRPGEVSWLRDPAFTVRGPDGVERLWVGRLEL